MPNATTEQICSKLADIISEVLEIDPAGVRMNMTLVDDLKVDSLSMVEVVVAAMVTFDITIPDEAVKDLRTVADFVHYIESASAAS